MRLVVIAAVACVTSGCSLISTLYPKREHRLIVKRTSEVTVRAAPDGAVIVAPDGTVLGPAPRAIRGAYDTELTWKERRIAPVGISALLAMASFMTSSLIFALATEGGKTGQLTIDGESKFWLGATIVTGADFFYSALQYPTARQQNFRARNEPVRRTVPRDAAVRVRWPGFDSVDVALRFPTDTTVVATRPTAVTFEQALLHWERNVMRTPTPTTMLQLGAAHLARAEADRDRAAATRAVEYLDGYLRSEPKAGDERTRAETMLVRARELAK